VTNPTGQGTTLKPASPIGAKTRAEDIRRQLADEIVLGQVPPGERLDEASLAACQPIADLIAAAACPPDKNPKKAQRCVPLGL
jgi:hypothetical protein